MQVFVECMLEGGRVAYVFINIFIFGKGGRKVRKGILPVGRKKQEALKPGQAFAPLQTPRCRSASDQVIQMI